MGYVAFAVQHFGLSLQEAWSMSPPEWWTMWSLRFGQRKKRIDSGLSDEDVRQMRINLDEAVRKEKEERG